MNTDPEMQLPEGKTCADCAFEKQCCSMFGAKPENTWCDFHPVRFVASNKSVIAALTKTKDNLLEALDILLAGYDEETCVIHVAPEPYCQECTGNLTPHHLDKGPCPHHRVIAAVQAARGKS